MLRLTALNYDRPIWVNLRLITAIEGRDGGSAIYFDNNNTVLVKETPEEIGEMWS